MIIKHDFELNNFDIRLSCITWKVSD